MNTFVNITVVFNIDKKKFFLKEIWNSIALHKTISNNITVDGGALRPVGLGGSPPSPLISNNNFKMIFIF